MTSAERAAYLERRAARPIRCKCGDLVSGYCDTKGCGAPVCDKHEERNGNKVRCPEHVRQVSR